MSFHTPNSQFELYSATKQRVARMQKRTGTWHREQKTQEFPALYVIGLMGKAVNEKGDVVGVKRVGKDTAADMMALQVPVNVHCSKTHFAQGLKQTLSQHYGIDLPIHDTNEFKEAPIHRLNDWSWRRLLEIAGTDLARKGLGQKLGVSTDAVWSNKVLYTILKETLSSEDRMAAEIYGLSDYDLFERDPEEPVVGLGVGRKKLFEAFKEIMKEKELPSPPDVKEKLIFIPDLRFPNEYHMLKSLPERHPHIRVIILQVLRRLPEVPTPTSLHPSNQVYPEMEPDHIIINDGDLNTLRKDCETLIHQLLQG